MMPYFSRHSTSRRTLFAMAAATAVICGAEDNTSGLIGLKEVTVAPGKTAPNGYVFSTTAPDNYTGFVSYAGSPDGILGLRCRNADNNYASWELRPELSLPPGGPYQASVSLKHSQFADRPQIGIEIFSFDAAGKPQVVTHILHNTAVTDQWHTISGEFKVPEGSVKLRVRVDLTNPGELLLKDLYVGTPKAADTAAAAPFAADRFRFRTGYVADAGSVPSAEVPPERRYHDGEKLITVAPWAVAETAAAVTFTVNGEAGIPHAMRWVKNLTPPLKLDGFRYYTLRYRATGIMRKAPVEGIVQLRGRDNAGQPVVVDMLNTATAFDDSQFHTVTGKLPANMVAGEIAVQLRTRFSQATLAIADIAFDAALPQSDCHAAFPADGKFQAIALDGLCNADAAGLYAATLDRYGILQDRILDFSQPEIQLEGIPFRLAAGRSNLVKPPFDDRKNQERIPFLGETASRQYLAPFSREDAIVVPVNQRGAALYFLLLSDTNPAQALYALPNRPLRLDDMENLTVELQYADGTAAKAFPYSLENRAFYISGRSSGVYAVALDPRKTLTQVTLHFYSFKVDLLLAAVTVGAATPEFAALLQPEPKLELEAQPLPEQPVRLTLNDHILTVNQFEFDLADGFTLRHLPDGKAAPASGLAVRVGNDSYTGRNFTVTDAAIRDGAAILTLQGNGEILRHIIIRLRLRPNRFGGIEWSGSVANRSSKELNLRVAPGAMRDLALDGTRQDQIFFPRFRSEVSGRNATYRAAYGQEFMHQYFDFFNPALARGLMLMVDNRDHAKLEFLAARNDRGLNGDIVLQEPFAVLKPGAERPLPTVTWQPHGGDWHTATAIYRDFLAGFYHPQHAQNHDYFLKTMVNSCYHTTHTLAWRYYHIPPLLSKDKKTWYIDEVNQFEIKNLGRKLDFVHLWWSFSDAENRFQYGNWSSAPFYAQSGGLESFREAIRHYQEDLGIPVSLYTISDRYMNADIPGGTLPTAAVALAYPNGAPLVNATETYTCLNSDRWIDYAVQDLAKLMRDTGAKILYSDVISSFNGTKCYSPDHGHEVPSNSIKGDLKFLSGLRAALPEDVAVWTEYGLPDTTSMYSDGFISYYFMELQEYFGPVCDIPDRTNLTEFEPPFAVVRYLLPRYKLFALPVGIEAGNKPSQVDYAFFNGDVFHEDTWFLHESRLRERINRALKIKDAYSDCFLSETPAPRVQTLAGGVYANRFPGRNRTLWTLCNATAATIEKPVLAIPHRDGARYRDLWNDRELTPKIVDGQAVIVLKLDPQQVGAVAQEF